MNHADLREISSVLRGFRGGEMAFDRNIVDLRHWGLASCAGKLYCSGTTTNEHGQCGSQVHARHPIGGSPNHAFLLPNSAHDEALKFLVVCVVDPAWRQGCDVVKQLFGGLKVLFIDPEFQICFGINFSTGLHLASVVR